MRTLPPIRSASEPDELEPSTRAIVDAAEKRGIPWSCLGDGLVQLGYGRHRKFIHGAMGSQTSAVAVAVAGDKAHTKALLARAGVPAPAGRVVRSAEEAATAVDEIGPPVAIKPLDANHGKGVSLDLWTGEQAVYAYEIASQFSRRVVVEQMLEGRDYRVLVVGGRVVAACERIPARVIGDGASTIQELIGQTPIRVDRGCLSLLNKQGFQLDSVPPREFAVHLRESANLADGGAAVDVTGRVHPSIARICERAARAVGLDICGVDLVVADISEPFTDGGVVELNAAPDIRMHHCPSEGEARDVASAIVRMLYPEGNARIPIVSVAGLNDTAGVARLVAHILAEGGSRIGTTTAEQRSSAAVLFDPEVDLAVLEAETATGDLAFDWCDVAVMTGMESHGAERVREGGTLVLNADDESMGAAAAIGRNVVWYALHASNAALEGARRQGATVYYVDQGHIHEVTGANRRRIMNVAEMRIDSAGVALAAVAACRALGTGVAQIRAGLRSFQTGAETATAGLFAVAGKSVLLD